MVLVVRELKMVDEIFVDVAELQVTGQSSFSIKFKAKRQVLSDLGKLNVFVT